VPTTEGLAISNNQNVQTGDYTPHLIPLQVNNWLLKRDLDPGSNDNDPMWLEKAA
jgi:hypothetical protein